MTAPAERHTWTSTYRVSSESRRRRILRTFGRVEHPGITATATARGDDLLVVLECASAAADMRARRIVLSLDLMAQRVDLRAA